MAISPGDPHALLAAVKRIYSRLPALLGAEEWQRKQAGIDDYISKLEARPGEQLIAVQLFSELAAYDGVREKLAQEMAVQQSLASAIDTNLQAIAGRLGFEPDAVGGLQAAAYANLSWDIESAPESADMAASRSIRIPAGGIGGAKSVKLKNLKLDLGGFSKISAGFITTGYEMVEKPHPVLVAAGILLTVYALHDALKIDIGEQEACVFWGMIKLQEGAERSLFDENEILAKTNSEREQYGLEPLNEKQVRHSLYILQTMKCIGREEDGYTVKEKFKIT